MEYIQCLVNLLIMIQPIYREQMIANNDRIFYSINFIKYNIIFYHELVLFAANNVDHCVDHIQVIFSAQLADLRLIPTKPLEVL